SIHQLYIFQLENYEFSRFAARMYEGLWRPRQSARKPLVWTPKAVALFVVAVFVEFLAAGLAATSVLNGAAAWVLFAVLAILLAYGFWLFLLVAAALLWPLDFALKQIVIGRAAAKLRSLPKIRVVGIAGSYGKTTFKNIAATILGESFKTIMTPDSVNTPVGIARWILRSVAPDAEVLVVEFGEYYRGDIKKLCQLIPPDISVITGVNEAHLERLGNLETTASTIFEAAVYAKQQAVIVVNGADELAVRFAPGYAGGRRTLFYGTGKAETAWQAANPEFMQDGSGWTFDLSHDGKKLGRFRIPFLGEYALDDLIGAALIAGELGGKPEEAARGIAKLRTVAHRLQALPSENKILIIDDSYNGNPSGAAEAVKVLGRFLGRRRLYVTPGLVEMGKNST
ncbi:MAG: Mur ligase family protein, partial [Candidatus Micrarchaeota archaeon]|nr:Mur ligase family protein [Candidatus Micrarchaeota archaeon]